MKKYYTTLILSLTVLFCTAQGYEFGIVHISNYDFKIVAIPDFDSSGNTDISDIGFALMLPAGSFDITNDIGLLSGTDWTVTEYDATFLTGQGLGDGTKDAFQFNLPPGQSILSHTSGQQIDLVSFSITNSPISGEMSILLNNDPIAVGAGGVLDSFYNSNIDASTTQDYFSGLATGLESFMFSVLNIEEINALNFNLSVYPNPTQEILYVDLNQKSNYSIIDVLGKIIKTGCLVDGKNELDLKNNEGGIYFLRINNLKGSIIKKIIKD